MNVRNLKNNVLRKDCTISECWPNQHYISKTNLSAHAFDFPASIVIEKGNVYEFPEHALLNSNSP